MIVFLRVLFLLILVSMLAVTGWAASQVVLWETPRAVATHPWFIATLADAYWGFITFYCWVFYKETTWPKRVLWLLLILLLGNIAMAIYVLIQLFRVRANSPLSSVLIRHDR